MADALNETDEGLVGRIQNGDHQAFAILVKRHTDKFYGLAWRLLGNHAEADDVVQDAFLKLWAQPDLFRADAGARFTTWFYRVVSNMALDRLRGRKRWTGPEILEGMADSGMLSDQGYEEKEMQKQIEYSISGLPERQKLALNLCFYEGVSVQDAAGDQGGEQRHGGKPRDRCAAVDFSPSCNEENNQHQTGH